MLKLRQVAIKVLRVVSNELSTMKRVITSQPYQRCSNPPTEIQEGNDRVSAFKASQHHPFLWIYRRNWPFWQYWCVNIPRKFVVMVPIFKLIPISVVSQWRCRKLPTRAGPTTLYGRTHRFSESLIISMLWRLRSNFKWRGVVLGVRHLHEQDPKIIHGDLKPVRRTH